METLKEYWAIIASCVALGYWLVRLEAGMNDNAKEVRRLWKQREEDMRKSSESRTEVHEMLTELRADVKDILGRLPK